MKEVIITTTNSKSIRILMTDDEFKKLGEVSDRLNLDWNFHEVRRQDVIDILTTNQLISRLKPINYKHKKYE